MTQNNENICNFLVFGLIAPIGCSKIKFFKFMDDNLIQEEFNFNFENIIKISENYLKDFIDQNSNKDKKIQLIDIGNKLRETTNNNAILAIKAITEIIKILRLNNNNSNKTQVFMISSLKHNDEVELLKKTFGPNLFLIGLNASEQHRKENLKGSDADILINRDKDEQLKNGQQMDKIFKKSHFFINVDVDDEIFDDEMKRFLNLIHGHPFCTPEPDESLMFNAYTASTRSASLNRQVGAVIVTPDNEITSTGCNEVPKFGGGHYWPNDPNDAREFKRMKKSESTIDSNNQKLNEIANKIADGLLKANPGYTDINNVENMGLIKKNLSGNVIENYREEHAEQAAISSCTRHGISTLKCKLYCTTLPCHLCIKSIVSSGIEQVFYIEPYSKSKIDLYDDSITFLNEEKKVKFTQFEGVGPARFYDLFSTNYSAGYDLKRSTEIENEETLKIWEKSKKIPRIPSNNLANIILKFLDKLEINFINGIKIEDDKFQNFAEIINEDITELKNIKQKIISSFNI